MIHEITVPLTRRGIEALMRKIMEYQRWVQVRAERLARALAERGYEYARIVLADHVFSGETLAGLRVEQVDELTFAIKAESRAILFVEFGAGLIGFGHPEAGLNGMGPGTFPGRGHWNNPNGWWYPTDDPRLIIKVDDDGQGLGHSYGMRPAMPIYGSMRQIEQDLNQIVQEVFVD